MSEPRADAVALETRSAYARWAPLYPPVAHNPAMRAEQEAMAKLWPPVRGRVALDLACGSGRYSRVLREEGAADVVAVDSCEAMLAQVESAQRVIASMMRLPFAEASFDVVICGLALGHAGDIHVFMAEMARILRRGGDLLYSDIHPAAAKAGLVRSFKDTEGRTHTVPHRCFEVAAQYEALTAAGLFVRGVEEVRVGQELTERFPKSEDFYRDWHGIPLLLAVRASKC
jgi:ubiquinone/menaquinone biosynthesis C-methylase UbiE